MYVFVACSKSKLHIACTAQEIYSASALFNKRLAYAKKIVPEDKIFILSAKYGLLKLTDPVEPYDCYMGDQSAEYKFKWMQMVLKQMQEAGIDRREKTYFATGEEYWKQLSSAFKDYTTEKEVVKKALGRGGIGMALQYYDLKIAGQI